MCATVHFTASGDLVGNLFPRHAPGLQIPKSIIEYALQSRQLETATDFDTKPGGGVCMCQ